LPCHPKLCARSFPLTLSRAGYKEIQPELVKELTRICHFCQLNTKAPGRFKFSLKDDIDFNYEIIIDIMYLDGRPVLHIVDAATAFQAARFLRKDVSTKSVWEALRLCWIDVYLGPPDIIITDAGKQLTSTEFNQNARAISIEVREVPVEAHHSIGKVERYHVPIRRAFNILKEELPDASTEGILQMAVKAVNDTAGPNGLVPTLLVFGAYPRMTREAPPSPSITQRAEAIQKAMKELRHLQAKRQVTEGLGMRNGPTPISTLPLQSQVIVWRENLGWKGPFTLLAAQGQTCLVEVNGRPVSFRSTSVRRYFEDSSPEGQGDQERPQDKQRPSSYQAPPQSGGTRETLHEQEQDWQPRRSKRKQKPKAVFDNSTFLSTKEQADLSLSLQLRKEGKIVTPGAPFEESDTKELENLLGQQVMNFIQFDPTKHRVRIFNSRMVREVKGKATQEPYEKSRLVIQGHSDNGKANILCQAPTIQRSSQRVILGIAPSLLSLPRGISIYLRDITQAYIQAQTPLNRSILANLPTELKPKYPSGTIMELIKPLYGIPEAGLHWFFDLFQAPPRKTRNGNLYVRSLPTNNNEAGYRGGCQPFRYRRHANRRYSHRFGRKVL
jgi:hypothetical protein